MFGPTQITSNTLKGPIVIIGRSSAELRKDNNRISYIGTASDIGIKEFPKQRTKGEPLGLSEVSVLSGTLGRTRRGAI
jgi:hypothetical protein